jgi:hypothetical protein
MQVVLVYFEVLPDICLQTDKIVKTLSRQSMSSLKFERDMNNTTKLLCRDLV